MILRFSKHAKWRPHHRFQHLYSILLYGLLTLKWAILTDFIQLTRYQKRKLSYANSKSHSTQWVGLIISKMVYFSVWILVPLFVFNFLWWKVLIGFFVMHYTAGLILSLVFQLAHVIGEARMHIQPIEVYATHLEDHPVKGHFDGILFFSPSGVRGYAQSNGFENTHSFCLGNATAAEVALHTSQYTVAKEPSESQLLLSLKNHITLHEE